MGLGVRASDFLLLGQRSQAPQVISSMRESSAEAPLSAGNPHHRRLQAKGLPHRITVCPISRHPGFVATLERLLGGAEFKIRPLRLEPDSDRGPRLVSGKVPQRPRLPRASVFVLDLSSTRLEAEALIERIRSEQPRARIVDVQETASDEKVFPYLRLGVRGVVRYVDAEQDLASAARAVMSGDFWLQPRQLARFVDWMLAMPSYRGTLNEPAMLSRREREVLVAVLSGLTNKEIALGLHISERTAKFHVSHLLQKLGAHRRADLIAKQYKLWPAIS